MADARITINEISLLPYKADLKLQKRLEFLSTLEKLEEIYQGTELDWDSPFRHYLSHFIYGVTTIGQFLSGAVTFPAYCLANLAARLISYTSNCIPSAISSYLPSDPSKFVDSWYINPIAGGVTLKKFLDIGEDGRVAGLDFNIDPDKFWGINGWSWVIAQCAFQVAPGIFFYCATKAMDISWLPAEAKGAVMVAALFSTPLTNYLLHIAFGAYATEFFKTLYHRYHAAQRLQEHGDASAMTELLVAGTLFLVTMCIAVAGVGPYAAVGHETEDVCPVDLGTPFMESLFYMGFTWLNLQASCWIAKCLLSPLNNLLEHFATMRGMENNSPGWERLYNFWQRKALSGSDKHPAMVDLADFKYVVSCVMNEIYWKQEEKEEKAHAASQQNIEMSHSVQNSSPHESLVGSVFAQEPSVSQDLTRQSLGGLSASDIDRAQEPKEYKKDLDKYAQGLKGNEGWGYANSQGSKKDFLNICWKIYQEQKGYIQEKHGSLPSSDQSWSSTLQKAGWFLLCWSSFSPFFISTAGDEEFGALQKLTSILVCSFLCVDTAKAFYSFTQEVMSKPEAKKEASIYFKPYGVFNRWVAANIFSLFFAVFSSGATLETTQTNMLEDTPVGSPYFIGLISFMLVSTVVFNVLGLLESCLTVVDMLFKRGFSQEGAFQNTSNQQRHAVLALTLRKMFSQLENKLPEELFAIFNDIHQGQPDVNSVERGSLGSNEEVVEVHELSGDSDTLSLSKGRTMSNQDADLLVQSGSSVVVPPSPQEEVYSQPPKSIAQWQVGSLGIQLVVNVGLLGVLDTYLGKSGLAFFGLSFLTQFATRFAGEYAMTKDLQECYKNLTSMFCDAVAPAALGAFATYVILVWIMGYYSTENLTPNFVDNDIVSTFVAISTGLAVSAVSGAMFYASPGSEKSTANTLAKNVKSLCSSTMSYFCKNPDGDKQSAVAEQQAYEPPVVNPLQRYSSTSDSRHSSNHCIFSVENKGSGNQSNHSIISHVSDYDYNSVF